MKMKSLITTVVLFFFLAGTATAQPSPNNYNNMNTYGYQRFTPAMAIIIVILIAALFFMGFFAIYIRQRQAVPGPAAGAANAATGRSRRAATRGLEASVIATFPTMEYSEVKGLKIGKGALECAVCICEFEDDETLRLLPKCDHVFHPECIDAWLGSHTTCPVCRADLVPDPDQPSPLPTPALSAASIVDVEAQVAGPSEPRPEVLHASKTLNRNRTRSGGLRRMFPRSHSTGHSVVAAGESTERFTLRLPVEVRKVMVSRQLVRASSMELPREASSRQGYREAAGRRLTKSDRWVFSSFLARMSSFNSPKVASLDAGGGERMSDRIVGPDVHRSDANRPPV